MCIRDRLNNAQDAFEVAMARRDGRYLVTSVKRVKASNEGSEMVVVASPDKEAPKPPATASTTEDTSKNDKVVTKVDEFGSKKVVSQDIIANATKEVDKEKSKNKDKDNDKMCIRDRV